MISLDIPSGLTLIDDSDSKQKQTCVEASITLSTQGYKEIFFHPTCVPLLGKVICVPVDFPTSLKAKNLQTIQAIVPTFIPPIRNPYAHKYTYGRSLLIAGSKQYPGAAILAAHGCLSTGASYLNAITYGGEQKHLQHQASLNNPSLPPQVIPNYFYDSHLRPMDLNALKKMITQANHILIGPGMGTHKETTLVMHQILHQSSPKNIIIDADGITHLKRLIENKQYPVNHPHHILLTPHYGELQQLLKPLKFSLSPQKLPPNHHPLLPKI